MFTGCSLGFRCALVHGPPVPISGSMSISSLSVPLCFRNVIGIRLPRAAIVISVAIAHAPKRAELSGRAWAHRCHCNKGLCLANLSKLVNELSNLTVLEAGELAKILEERWRLHRRDFVSEDDLSTFQGWLRYQGVDAATMTPDELVVWRGLFDERRKRILAGLKVGLMQLQPVPGQYLYGVAVREGSDLWLTLWVRRSVKGEFFVMIPRADRESDIHTSYHLDGTLHMKRQGRTVLPAQKRQPLTGKFQGTEHLGSYMGHGPKTVGAVCDPAAFSGVVGVAPGALGPRDGAVFIDLVEPGCEPIAWPNVVQKLVFRDIVPWIVIRIAS
jgi:hypothetical protein